MTLPTLPPPDMVHVDAQGYSTPCYTSESLLSMIAEIDRLRTQNQALELDAKRYRYWRENHGWTGYFDDGATNSESNDDVDKAIDKAISQAEGGV